MPFDPADYHEVYETTDEHEAGGLMENGWQLLDEQAEEVDTISLRERAWRDQVAGKRFQGVRTPAVREQTTYVLGWPKDQQTISEDEFGRSGPGADA